VLVKTERKGLDNKDTSAKPNSEELYHMMLDEVRDYAIILLDTEGNIREWNKGAESVYGYTAPQIAGKNVEIFYTDADRANGLLKHLLKLAVTQGSVIHEGWRVKKGGVKFWAGVVITAMLDKRGALIGFTLVARDLTERQKAEDHLRQFAEDLQTTNEELEATNEELEAANEELGLMNEELRRSEERYHRMVAEVQDYAIILLNREGDIEDWNAGAEFIKGYTANEIIGKNFRIFYTKEDREAKLPEKLIDIAVRKGRAHHEGWRVRKDGTKFWGSITITALHGSHNNVVGFTKVTRDLTERKMAEDSLKRKNVELQDANKELEAMNKELSSFAYISSHDLQEPLRKIQTFSTRVMELEENNISEKGLGYLNRIVAAAQRMRLLIDDLLTYSRANNAEQIFEPTDLNSILRDVLNDLDNNIEEKKAVIECNPLPVMNVIPFQFYQLLFNLLINALKFTKPGRSPYILIRSATLPADRVPGLQKALAPSYYHLSVADNGIGFLPEHGDRIFEVFQRLHNRDEYEGTGIGLAICKKIVENHNGIIRAQGKPGEGATFHIYLPANTDK
jgi:PAS domain S-box-containing protein